MPIVRLSEQQQEKAWNVAKTVAENPDSVPQDFVTRWEPKPSVVKMEMVDEYETDVRVDEIIGVAKQNTERLVPNRLVPLLRKLHNQEYEKTLSGEPTTPPHLEEINGHYYVSADGIHRTLAHKILDIETIHAEVNVYRDKS